jgi:hypothetical protein
VILGVEPKMLLSNLMRDFMGSLSNDPFSIRSEDSCSCMRKSAKKEASAKLMRSVSLQKLMSFGDCAALYVQIIA